MLVPSMQVISYTIIARECYPTSVLTGDENTLSSRRYTAYLGYIWPKNVASCSTGQRIHHGTICSDREFTYLYLNMDGHLI